MPPKSTFVQRLDEIQQMIHPGLKTKNYKKKGRTYNKIITDGIIHVINFQSGQFPIGDYVIPGVRESSYGSFAVNLGVFMRDIHDQKETHKIPDFVQEYHCHIRCRLSELIRKQKDFWLLDENYLETGKKIAGWMNSLGQQWFDHFTEPDLVVKNLQDPTIKNLSANIGKLDASLILLKTEREKGILLFREHFAASSKHRPHQEYLRELAKKLDIEL